MPDTTTQQEREALSPCPFCSGVNIIHCGHHMFCYSCGAEGPDADTQHESDAAEQWNRRATLSQRDEPVAEGKACQTCNGSGVVGRAPDDYFHCPDCTTPSPSLREVLADAANHKERSEFLLRATREAQDLGSMWTAEVLAWRARFPQYTYRRQDDCVILAGPQQKESPNG